MAKGASLGILLGNLGKPPKSGGPKVASDDDGDEDKGEDITDEAMVGVADDIRGALAAKDSEALADALKAFIEMC